MASSSLSQLAPNQEFNAFCGKRRIASESSRLFDVFINHRGPDVKQTLAIQLYKSLELLGMRAFLDSQEKQLGESFPSAIETAISSASVHVAIFSRGYADSPWCLAELVLMLQSQAKIIPVFYGVKPSDLRHIEKGAYAEAFIRYEEKGRYQNRLSEWKEALQSLSLIAGEESLDSFSDCNCQNIVAAVQKEVQRKVRFHVAQYPVGLNNIVQDFERRCLEELVQDFENQCGLKKGKDRVKVVGIFGMGGVGKTTLAKKLFNRKSSYYYRASFLFDVREASERRELPSLQRKLLKDLFDKQDLSFTSTEEGTSYLSECHKRSPAHLRFLIFLDDINHVEQLNALLVMDTLERLVNCLVIVTTRDAGVLISAGITVGYHLKGMTTNYGSELFCWHAFNQPNPPSEYQELVESFVDVCGGLPLSLQVLGRHVHGRSKDYWRSELAEVRKTLPQEVKQRLKISFDALKAEEKQVFMDIACFFGGRKQSLAEVVWNGSGWNARHALDTLRDKCLLEEKSTTSHNLRMHDHLRDLGREMAAELSPPHRLWRPKDLKYLESRGFRYILNQTLVRCFYSFFDKSMNCPVTFFLGQSDNCFEASPSLLWLELQSDNCFDDLNESMNSIPSWISLHNLQCLKIEWGQPETLWMNHLQELSQLKRLDIKYCTHLQSGSGISKLANLLVLKVDLCPNLKDISLGHLSCLGKLTIRNCYNLEGVSGISSLAKLVKLKIVGCGNLVFERLCLRGMTFLVRVTLDDSVMVKYCKLDGCQKLKAITFGYRILAELRIRDCPELKKLPDFRDANRLQRIRIDGCGKFKCLHLHACPCLRSVSGNLGVKKLSIRDCAQLEDFPSLSYCKEIDIDNCEKLHENLTLPTSLIDISIRSCRDLQRVTGFSHLSKLTKLFISDCPLLQELLNLSRLRYLERIVIDSCER